MLCSLSVLMNIGSEMDEETFEWTARSVPFENLTVFSFLSLLAVTAG